MDGKRLGQRFASIYFKHPYLDILNEPDDGKALDLIIDWLVKNEYYETLPKPIETVTHQPKILVDSAVTPP
jgi:disulfide oxidoreductase YuzD